VMSLIVLSVRMAIVQSLTTFRVQAAEVDIGVGIEIVVVISYKPMSATAVTVAVYFLVVPFHTSQVGQAMTIAFFLQA
jgi:hypothetical protein